MDLYNKELLKPIQNILSLELNAFSLLNLSKSIYCHRDVYKTIRRKILPTQRKSVLPNFEFNGI